MSEADLAKRKKEKRQEAGRFLQLLVVVGSFLFGYLPRTGSIFLNIFSLPKNILRIIFKEWLVACSTIFVYFLI